MRDFIRNELRKLNEACHEIAEHSLRGWGFAPMPSDNDDCLEACGHKAPCDACFDDLDALCAPRDRGFERALWNTSEPNHGPMNIYHPDSDFFGG